MATPKTTAKKAPAKKLTKEEVEKKKAREERLKEEAKTRMTWMTKRDQLDGGQATATGQSLMPPSIAKGLVSREEYVNLLVVTYTEKLETEMNELNESAANLKQKLDAVASKLYADLVAACKAQLNSPGMQKLIEGYTELMGEAPVVSDDIPVRISTHLYGKESQGLPAIRFDTGVFHDHGPGREKLTLVDICYFRIFDVNMAARPKVKNSILPVTIYVGKETKDTEKAYYRIIGSAASDLGVSYQTEVVSTARASIKIEGRVQVPEFTEEQKSAAVDLVIGYEDIRTKETRIGEIQGLLQNGEKLRRKALAVMTAQAIGADGIKALPQLESKL